MSALRVWFAWGRLLVVTSGFVSLSSTSKISIGASAVPSPTADVEVTEAASLSGPSALTVSLAASDAAYVLSGCAADEEDMRPDILDT